MGISKAQLLAELTEHNEFFDMLVDMIPSKLYVSSQNDDVEADADATVVTKNKYFRNPSKNDSKSAQRTQSKGENKRRKGDAQAVTVVPTSELLKQRARGTPLLPHPKVVTPTRSKPGGDEKPHDHASTKSRIEVLREKLHAKIAEKQQQNGPLDTNGGDDRKDPQQVSKRAARRAEKKRRREEAEKRKRSAAPSQAEGPGKKMRHSAEVSETSVAARAADLAQIDYGRLAGLNADASLQKTYEQSNKALQNVSKGKNLHKLLADAEGKRQKLEELKQGDEQARAQAQQMLWSDTFREADGQRIKDDPAKIRKALKRKAAKKAKSQKAWNSRTAQVQRQQADRQKVRTHNLQARKAGGAAGANLSRKEIRRTDEDPGRRLSRAGFEGRKRDFLNGTDAKKNKKGQHQ